MKAVKCLSLVCVACRDFKAPHRSFQFNTRIKD